MRIPAAIVLACLVLGSGRAEAYTCADVRYALSTYGMRQLIAWARQYRVTAAQRRAALSCIRGHR